MGISNRDAGGVNPRARAFRLGTIGKSDSPARSIAGMYGERVICSRLSPSPTKPLYERLPKERLPAVIG